MTTSTRRLRYLATTLFAFVAFALVQASLASAAVTWTADAERAWNREWANYSCEDASRVSQVSSPVAQGSRAYKIDLHDGDDSYGERCELGNGNPSRPGFPLFDEGDEAWVSWQTYLPDGYPVDTHDWNVFMQLKQLGSMGTPAISMVINDGQFKLMNADNNGNSGNTVKKWGGTATRGRWVKFTMHVKFSPDPDRGSVELFGDLDGAGMKTLMPETKMFTMKQEGGRAVQSHARIGMYRNPRIQGATSIYYDGYTIGTDRASVESNAFGGPGAGGDDAGSDSNDGSANTGDSNSDAATPAETRREARRRRRKRLKVWLRSARSVAASSSAQTRRLYLYGGVKRSARKSNGGRTVVIQIRREGRWHTLGRGWLGWDGRFSVRPLRVSGPAGKVKIRAYIPRVGRSNTLTARVG
jgi:hypothetical protein